MQFRVFGHEGLLEEDALLRIEPRGEVVGDDFDRVQGDGAGVRVVAGQRMPVGDEVEAVISGIILEADPILQRAEIMADVQFPGRPHAANDALLFSLDLQSLHLVFTDVGRAKARPYEMPSCLCRSARACLYIRPIPLIRRLCRGALQRVPPSFTVAPMSPWPEFPSAIPREKSPRTDTLAAQSRSLSEPDSSKCTRRPPLNPRSCEEHDHKTGVARSAEVVHGETNSQYFAAIAQRILPDRTVRSFLRPGNAHDPASRRRHE